MNAEPAPPGAPSTMDLFAIAAAPATTGFEPALHAADGFLSVPVALFMWVITAIVVGISVRKTNRTIDERMVPLMGVMAAFIFAAQMFNFQVAGGTSGHLLGRCPGGDPPWSVGRHARHGLRDRRTGARLLGRWPGRDGRQHLQHGHRRHDRRVRDLPGAVPACSAARTVGVCRRRRSPPGSSVVLGPIAMSLQLIVSGHQPGRDRADGDARRPCLHRHRRGADHRGGARVHRGDTQGPPGPPPRPRGRARAPPDGTGLISAAGAHAPTAGVEP